MTPKNYSDNVVAYYDNCQIDYELVWHLRSHLSMHYGYWHEGTRNLRDALVEMNHQLAVMAQIKEGDKVLDAGCGVGGSSIYLAQNYKCKVTGITLSDKQVNTCIKNAKEKGVSEIVHFDKVDYLNTPYPDNYFDVVWAIESVCYAEDKKDFLKEAYRVLRPSGRVIVADFFGTKKDMTHDETQLMDNWTNCWAIKSYARMDQFSEDLKSSGFINNKIQEATKKVLPSIKRLYYLFFPGILATKLGELIRLRNATQTSNTWSTYYQYKAYKKGLWAYCLYSGQKK